LLVCPPLEHPQEGGLQPEVAPETNTPPFLSLGIDLGVLSVLSFETAPFDLAFSASVAGPARHRGSKPAVSAVRQCC
jgi:hypothetical protein